MRHFIARGTKRLKELEGVELADFGQRAIAFTVDCILAVILVMLVAALAGFVIWSVRAAQGNPQHVSIQLSRESEAEKLVTDLVVPVLYFGLATYLGNGRTPGKRLMKIRTVSLVEDHMSLWHSVERALGYGAATLEFGFGFVQYFIHPFRRTIQDKIGETIVVKEKSFQALVASQSTNRSDVAVTADATRT